MDRYIFHHFVYSNNNPVIYLDCNGEKIRIFNCNDMEKEIRDANERARRLISECDYLSWWQKLWLRWHLDSAHSAIVCAVSKDCDEYTYGYSRDKSVINICKRRYKNAKEPKCIEATIFHEALHNYGFGGGEPAADYPEHKKVYCLEARCVKCSGINADCYCDN